MTSDENQDALLLPGLEPEPSDGSPAPAVRSGTGMGVRTGPHPGARGRPRTPTVSGPQPGSPTGSGPRPEAGQRAGAEVRNESGSRRPLPDQEARDRIAASLDETLFVEAGAGSGKTTAIVQRVVNLVASGVPVGKIAAITFTEAAARELRTKVRDALAFRGQADNHHHLQKAAGDVESAAFTTLHGFAHRLLSANPVEAGLPPGFTVADEIASLMAFDRAWSEFLNAVGDDLDLFALQSRAQAVGVKLGNLSEIARQFGENWDLLDLEQMKPQPLTALAVDSVVDQAVALGDLLSYCIAPNDDKLAQKITELVDDASRLSDDPLERLHWLAHQEIKGLTWGTKGNWSKPGSPYDVTAARAALRAVRDAAVEVRRSVVAEVLTHYRYLIAEFVLDRVAERQQAGELAFHDLLVLARRLLRNHAVVHRHLHQTYTRILLDEFQDTDPIQIELAVLLASTPRYDAGSVNDASWEDLAGKLPPGRLVVVGDPKQSIYRFRRADIEVYSAAEAALVDEPVELATNFRSVPGIVEWVNAFFGEVIGDGAVDRAVDGADGSGPSDVAPLRSQPPYRRLLAHRNPDPNRDTPVMVVGGEHPKGTKVGDIREQEAADIASLICQAMDEEWKVERNGSWLPLRLSDIAVLIPSRLSLPALESAFEEANLPFRPETSSLVYATQEVRDVLAAVRAVVEPENTIAVVASLRSNLFAINDEELLRWHLAGGRWDYRSGTDGVDLDSLTGGGGAGDGAAAGPVADAFAVLNGWHQRRWWCQAPELIDEIIRSRRLRETALAESRPRDRWRRYRFLAEQARQFAATTHGDLHDFVAWAEIQASDLARVTEPVPAEPDDDAVRVLTVHGSKGLEFPMVVLAGAPTQETNRGRGPKALFGDAGPEIGLSQDKTTAHFNLHASVEEVLDQHERVRLHYVAATRARDLLVVSAHHKAGMASAGRRTAMTLPVCEGLYEAIEPETGRRYAVEPATQLRLADGDWEQTRADWEREQQVLAGGANSAGPQVWSATALAEVFAPVWEAAVSIGREGAAGAGGDADAAGDADAGDEADAGRADGAWVEGAWVDAVGVGDPGEQRRLSLALGNAVHHTLETADFVVGPRTAAADRQLEKLARLHAATEGIPEHSGRVATLVRAALASDAVTFASRHRHWRELYVSAPVAGSQLEGFIDLCVDGPDGYVIIDYKTDAVASDEEIDAKVDHYRIQAAAYALMVRHITGGEVAECRFVFISEQGVHERVVADLEASEQQIVEFLDSSTGASTAFDADRGRTEPR